MLCFVSGVGGLTLADHPYKATYDELSKRLSTLEVTVWGIQPGGLARESSSSNRYIKIISELSKQTPSLSLTNYFNSIIKNIFGGPSTVSWC